MHLPRREYGFFALALLIVLLYVLHLTSDSIGGLFGIMWTDEGLYLMSAKNKVLFGAAHFIAHDGWRPELIAPLFYYFGLLTITPDEPIYYARLAMAILGLASAAIFAVMAARHNASRNAGWLCFIAITLNPVLYFYGRTALTEGLQFFILALIFACFWRAYHAVSLRRAVIAGFAAGALTGVFAIAKISAVPAACGLGAGMLALVFLHPMLKRPWRMLAAFCGGGILIVALYFGLMIGAEFPLWWHANIELEAMRRTPPGAAELLTVFFYKMSDILFYLCLMPVFAFYLPNLLFTADRRRGFVFILWIITVAMLIGESTFGGIIRRNFFSLSMLGVLFGFTAWDYFKNGFSFAFKPLTGEKLAACALTFLQACGLLCFFVYVLLQNDVKYGVLVAVFSMLIALSVLAGRPAYARLRPLIAAVAALSSLGPMAFQAFASPYTRENATQQVDSIVPADAIISGHTAPMYLGSSKRRLLWSNCVTDDLTFTGANDLNDIAERVTYLLYDPSTSDCKPSDSSYYHLVYNSFLFVPVNLGFRSENSRQWGYYGKIYLYEKQKP